MPTCLAAVSIEFCSRPRCFANTGMQLFRPTPTCLNSNILEILKPDAVVVQFQQTDVQIEAMRRYKKTLGKDTFFVYEIDDLFWRVPDASVHKATIAPDTKERIKTAASICDAITVTTEHLAREMRRLTGIKDIRVVPNDVPQHFINSALQGRRAATPTSTKPRVGWAGGAGHTGDLEVVGEIMKILGDEVHWVFFGLVPTYVEQALKTSLGMSDEQWKATKSRPDFQGLLKKHLNTPDGPALGLPAAVEYHSGVPFDQYAAALGALKLDIALAPLEDNAFNHCKSDLRIIEYGAAGFPVIASDIVTYRDCPHTVRVPHTAEAWAAAIRDMLAHPADREHYAEQLHAWVRTERCLDNNLAQRVKAYLPRNTETFVPQSITPSNQLATVGANLPGLPNFPTMAAAWEAMPGANILYLRPDAAVDALQFAQMLEPLQQGYASVSALTNDSLYPAPTQFAAIDAISAQRLNVAAAVLEDEPISIPCPTGPCMLFAGTALARFGLPDERAFNGDFETAAVDWGARAAEGGRAHAMIAKAYIHAGRQVDRSKEQIDRSINHIVGWLSGLGKTLQAYIAADPLATVRQNLELMFHRLHYDAPRPEPSYLGWSKIYDTIGVADRAAMAKDMEGWTERPHVNVVMPTFNTPEKFLIEAIESVLNQTYPNWSLLIADDQSTDPNIRRVLDNYAGGDSRIKVTYRDENGHICKASNTALEMAEDGWVVFLDHDDVLAPHALYMIAREAMTNPGLEFIYSDSDKLKEDGTRDHPYFAPDFNYELLLAQNYVTHLAAYRLEGIRAIGGFRPGYEGSQDWDLVLRYLTERTGTPPDRRLISHIQHVLYHWRMSATSTAGDINAKPYALQAGRKSVLAHLTDTKQLGAYVGPNPIAPVFTMVRFMVTDPAPKVSIIIPTKDNEKVLGRCMGSLLQRTAYPNYEVLIVDNGSKDPASLRLLTELQKDKRIRVLRKPGPFNFSLMNNAAVAEATGDFVCLLNDDTEIVEAAWLNDLVGMAGRPGVGAVGAKLLYPNGMVQQNGIIIDWEARPGSKAMHMFQQLPAQHPGQGARNLITQEWTALTGACLVIRKATYDAIGGLDADAFPIDYNDVDFCLRLYKAGYRNLVSAQAMVIHHEGTTKRKHIKEHSFDRVVADEARLMARHSDVIDGQWNRNLMFHPHLDKAMIPSPAKPWTAERERILLINGTVDDAVKAWSEGFLPFCATLDGHRLHLTYPAMAQVKPLDLRGSIEPFLEIVGVLGIPRLVLCGIGNGTLGAIGFFADVADAGWPVEYRPTETADIRDPHIGPAAWDAIFRQLLEAQQRAATTLAEVEHVDG